MLVQPASAQLGGVHSGNLKDDGGIMNPMYFYKGASWWGGCIRSKQKEEYKCNHSQCCDGCGGDGGDWWLIGDECVLGLEPAKPRASPALAQAGPYRRTHPPEPENSHEHIQPQTQQIWSMERYDLLLLPCAPYVPFPCPHIALRVGTPIQHTTA